MVTEDHGMTRVLQTNVSTINASDGLISYPKENRPSTSTGLNSNLTSKARVRAMLSEAQSHKKYHQNEIKKSQSTVGYPSRKFNQTSMGL